MMLSMNGKKKTRTQKMINKSKMIFIADFNDKTYLLFKILIICLIKLMNNKILLGD